MTSKVTFAVWNLSNCHTSGNIAYNRPMCITPYTHFLHFAPPFIIFVISGNLIRRLTTSLSLRDSWQRPWPYTYISHDPMTLSDLKGHFCCLKLFFLTSENVGPIACRPINCDRPIECLHINQEADATWLVISGVLSKLKDFWRSYAVTSTTRL